jgi:hypothetical protein
MKGIELLLAACVAIAAVLTLVSLDGLPNTVAEWVGPAAIGVLVVVAVLSFFNLWLGASVRDIARRGEIALADKIEGVQLRIAGVEKPPSDLL